MNWAWPTRLWNAVPNPAIFCNAPWYELQIYWDGSFGICCTERHKLYADSESQYNIANMTIQDWYRSEPVKKFRQQLLSDKKNTVCNRCYMEEDYGGISKRLKGNIKSAVFSQAFLPSFEQSPGRQHFDNTEYQGMPIDIHLDLGNHCNLTCKMCEARSSSKIAVQEVKWGIQSSRQFVGTDWTTNYTAWQSFKLQLLDIPKLSNIHFMGGETLLSSRVDDLVDFLIQHKRFDIGFSVVTNGTIYKPDLIKKMTAFKRVGLEISLESTTRHNDYIRQGTDTAKVFDIVEKYQKLCNGTTVDLTIRPAISALSIGSFWTLLEYCLEKNLVIKPLWCIRPDFLNPVILPTEIKNQYLPFYTKIAESLSALDSAHVFNASDHHNVGYIVKHWCNACITVLMSDQPVNSDMLLQQMVAHCAKWDSVANLSPEILYPEFIALFNKYEYQVSG